MNGSEPGDRRSSRVAALDNAVAALNPTKRRSGKTVIQVRP